MKHLLIDKTSYKLHLIKTDKFKTITFKLIFRDEINKDEINIRNLLVDNLTASTLKYNSKKKLSIAKQELYAINIYGNNRRFGNQFLTEFQLSFLDPKYTEEAMYEESLSFMSELIFNPNIENNAFEKDTFNIIKNSTISFLKTMKSNPNIVAYEKLKDLTYPNSPYSYHTNGYLEDIDKVTPESLYKYYQKFIKTNTVDIYVVGDIDFNQMESLVAKYFKFKTIKKSLSNIELNEIYNKKPLNICDKSMFNQSILMLNCVFKKPSFFEIKYVIPIYNIILGNSPDSVLFKNVREKKSLAYRIGSSYSNIDKILTISSGLSKENSKEANIAINNELTNLKKGLFTEKNISSAKKLYISVLKDIEEHPSAILDYYFTIDVLKEETLKEKETKIQKVTKEDIIKVAKKLNVAVTYLLEEK